MKRVIGMCLTVLAAVCCRADADWVRVAASNSRAEAKSAADYVCTGTNDELVLQRAIDDCARTGRDLYLSTGLYRLESVRDFGDGGPKTAVLLRNMYRRFSVIGDRPGVGGWPKDMPKFNAPVLYLDPAVVGDAGGESVDILRGGWSERGIMNGSALRMQDLVVSAPNSQCRMRAIDLRRTASVELRNISLQAFGEATMKGLKYPFDGIRPPIADNIGITLTDGSNNIPVELFNINSIGFGQCFQVGGEHVVMVNCIAAFGLYGYTFGNYEYHCGFNHPITLINCADEQNVNMPLFASCGDVGGKVHGMQEVTMISFNFERVEAFVPGKKLGDLMRETRPGTWRGQIGFVTQPKWESVNAVDLPLWAEDGSGRGFRTVNNAHKPACGSAERRSYYPQYMQQVFDTDLNKLLICTDPARRVWVDANGKEAK